MSDNERHSIFNPIRTTVVGGFVFLVPVVFVFILGAKALEIMEHIARPVVTALGVETRTILGIAIADLIIAAVIVGLCYLAGLMARSGIGTRIYAFIDDKLISIIPQYGFVKNMVPSGTESELEATLIPVIVRLDDSAMIAFMPEPPRDGLVTVYVPGAPNPWSGSILHVAAERVHTLDVPFSEVVRRLRVIGRGAADLLEAGGTSSAEVARKLAI
jgi:uncharacterized membrane protein